ncbi:MAG: hypothetical protein R3C68_16640 [Myxococcota bacterium]
MRNGYYFTQRFTRNGNSGALRGVDGSLIFPEFDLYETLIVAENLRSAVEQFVFLNTADPYDPKSFSGFTYLWRN